MEGVTRILLVEDNPGDVHLLRETLRVSDQFRFELSHAETLAEAKELLDKHPFDAILLDLSLPDSMGMNTVHKARVHAPDLPIVVLTSLTDESQGIEAIRLGVQDYLIKGQADGRTMVRAIRYAMEHKRAELQLQKAHDELEERVRERTAELEQTLVALQEEFDERVMMAQAVEENRDILRQVSELIPYGLWIADPGGGMTYLSNTFLQQTGLTMDDCRRFGWLQAVVPEERDRLMRDWLECVRAEKFWDYEFRIRGREGGHCTILSRGMPVRGKDGRIASWAGLNLDITDRKQLEQDLLDVLQKERERIAKVMEQTLGQTLRHAVDAAQSAQQRLEASGCPEAAVVIAIRESLNKGIAQMEALVRLIRPGEVRIDGLAEKVEEFCTDITTLHEVACEFKMLASVTMDEPQAVEQLFHIIRRSVLNSITYGSASHVWMTIETMADQLHVTVRDDGVALPGESPTNTLRLRVMLQRARRIGASLDIRIVDGGGTTVSCVVPVKNLQAPQGKVA